MCFSPYLGIGRMGGGSPKGLVHTQPADAVFHLGQLKNRSFRSFFLDTMIT